MLYKIAGVIERIKRIEGVSTPKLNGIMCNCTDLRHFPRLGTPPGGVGHELSAIRNVLRESRGSFSGSLLLSISLLSVRQPFSLFFDITVDNGIRFARGLSFSLHSISGGGCEITNAQGRGSGSTFWADQTRRPKGLFCVPDDKGDEN